MMICALHRPSRASVALRRWCAVRFGQPMPGEVGCLVGKSPGGHLHRTTTPQPNRPTARPPALRQTKDRPAARSSDYTAAHTSTACRRSLVCCLRVGSLCRRLIVSVARPASVWRICVPIAACRCTTRRSTALRCVLLCCRALWTAWILRSTPSICDFIARTAAPGPSFN